jgi:hypothetical protein
VELSKNFVNRGEGSHFLKFNGKSTPFLVPPHSVFIPQPAILSSFHFIIVMKLKERQQVLEERTSKALPLAESPAAEKSLKPRQLVVAGVAALILAFAALAARAEVIGLRSFQSPGFIAGNAAVSSSRFTHPEPYKSYHPAPVEDYIFNHIDDLGLNETTPPRPTCPLWTDSTHTGVHADLHAFLLELDNYNKLINAFQRVPDIRTFLNDTSRDSCSKLELHPDGLPGIFPSGQLSYTTTAGFVEPLLPPLRHPRYCFSGGRPYLLDLGYLIHDFAASCRKLKPTSRTVLIDMGASLNFHATGDLNKNP